MIWPCFTAIASFLPFSPSCLSQNSILSLDLLPHVRGFRPYLLLPMSSQNLSPFSHPSTYIFANLPHLHHRFPISTRKDFSPRYFFWPILYRGTETPPTNRSDVLSCAFF